MGNYASNDKDQQTDSHDSASNPTNNRFELKRKLADTLQGHIYSAIDLNKGQICVVKQTYKKLVRLKITKDGHNVLENFAEERRILRYLSSQKDSHSGFVQYLDEWESKHCYLYAMEMCQGGELFDYIKDIHTKGPVSKFMRKQSRLKQELMSSTNEWIKIVQHIFQQLVSCTAWLHSKRVCHLDMSLENTMISNRKQLTVKIIDFGVAKYYPDEIFQYDKLVGKTGYMSPEVFARKKYDPRSADIWSLGVMLFMMLVGSPPYKMPEASNRSFQLLISGKLKAMLKYWKRLRCVNAIVLDLLNKIFQYENNRITMDGILKHPFVNLIKDEKNVNVKKSVVESGCQLQDEKSGCDNSNVKLTTDVAIKFENVLGNNNLNREQLVDLLKNIEEKHNSIQKLRNKCDEKDVSMVKLQQILKELLIVYGNVEKRLNGFYIEQQSNDDNFELLE